MKKALLIVLVIAGSLLACLARAADIYVVVSADNTWRNVNQRDLLSLYMGRTQTLPSGEAVAVFDLPRDHPIREAFYAALTGMSSAQVNSYWSRLIFTGRTLPPPVVPSEQSMIEQLRRNPGAIGYLPRVPNDSGLRPLLVLRSALPD